MAHAKNSDWFLYLGTGTISLYVFLAGFASLLGATSGGFMLPVIPQQQFAVVYMFFGFMALGGIYVHYMMMRKMH